MSDALTPEKIIHAGRRYFNAGNYDAARNMAQEAMRHAPQNEVAWKLMHDCIKEKSLRTESLAFAEKWFEAMPDSKLAFRAVLSETLGLRKNKKKSKALFDAYVSRYPNDYHYILVCEMIYEMCFGSRKKAMELSDKLVSEFPNDVGFIVMQAIASYEAERCWEAFALAKKALSISPDDVSALRILAFSAFREMHFSEARKAAIRGLKLEPDLKIFHTIKNISLFGYFPIFWIGSLMVLLGGRVSGKLQLPTVWRRITNFITTGCMTYFGVVPIVQKLAIAFAEFGISGMYQWLGIGVIGWLIIPEILLSKNQNNARKKVSSVKLKDY